MLDRVTGEARIHGHARATQGGNKLGLFEETPWTQGGLEATRLICKYSVLVVEGGCHNVSLDGLCPGEVRPGFEPKTLRELTSPKDLDRLYREAKAFDDREGMEIAWFP